LGKVGREGTKISFNRGQLSLRSERILLRPLETSDVNEEYLSWLNDPEVARYLGVGGAPSTYATVGEYLERFQKGASDYIFAIIDLDTELHIGNVTLNHISRIQGTTDTGLIIGRKRFWGKGYASEAWSLVIEYAFKRLELRKIIAGVVDQNVASLRTLENLGFKIEGTLRQEGFVDDEYRDIYRLGLFQDEFRNFPTNQLPQ